MMEVSDHTIACTLTSLYLPGLGLSLRNGRHRWVAVENAVRQADLPIGRVPAVLARSGFWIESAHAEKPDVLAKAEKFVLAGQVLAANMDRYPTRWLKRLGGSAPPALWLAGPMPTGPFFTVVGARQVPQPVLRFAFDTAAEAVGREFAVASGGAIGCDRAAARGTLTAHGSLLEILPCGLDQVGRRGRCQLSLLAPGEPFSSAAAMERNALLYAISERAVVVHARLREGGAWQGAVEALRRRLSTVFVRDDGESAARALVALGAKPVTSPSASFTLSLEDESQGRLILG